MTDNQALELADYLRVMLVRGTDRGVIVRTDIHEMFDKMNEKGEMTDLVEEWRSMHRALEQRKKTNAKHYSDLLALRRAICSTGVITKTDLKCNEKGQWIGRIE